MHTPRIAITTIVGCLWSIVGFALLGAASGTAALPVNVVSVTTPVARGTEGHLIVRTAPYAECGATIQSQSDPDRTIATLPSQAADPAGLVTFTVRVPGFAKPGPYPVTVSCQGGGRAATTHLLVTVR